MPLLPMEAVPDRGAILVDANILVYAVGGQSAQCERLLRRIANEEVSGFVTCETLNEACHRLMVGEAFAKGLIRRPSAAALRSKADAVRSLTTYWDQITRIMDGGFLVIELDAGRMRQAQHMRVAHGFLATDSLILAAASELGIDRLASNDRDFERVDWLTVFRPTDLD
jgi:hypothetical protein